VGHRVRPGQVVAYIGASTKQAALFLLCGPRSRGERAQGLKTMANVERLQGGLVRRALPPVVPLRQFPLLPRFF
jgi:uncharacterized membrane protein YdjX (TVP38/TMEM64 family)